MTFTVNYTERIDGPYGTVEFVPHPGKDSSKLSKRVLATLDVGRGTWLINSPGWHPLWSQYVLSVVSLEPHPHLKPASLKFEGATHELIVFAIDPDKVQTVDTVHDHCRTGELPVLQPINIAEQFECSDEEILQVAWLAARAVVHGGLNPETSDSPELVREQWLSACVKTLAHLRGEAHAS